MKKGLKITLIVFGILVALLLLGGVFGYAYINYSPENKAILYVLSGDVQVDSGKGYAPAADGMKLGEDYRIKTGTGASAKVVLFDSVIVTLDPDTEIKVEDLSKDHLSVDQSKGTTWNKFTAVTGVGEFSVRTPKTVATIRGTAFEMQMDAVLVAEGVVEVKADGEVYMLREGRKLMLEDGKFVEKEISQSDYKRLAKRMQGTLADMIGIRNQEIEKQRNKYRAITDNLMQKYEVSEEDVWSYIDSIDKGEYDVDELLAQSPVDVKPVQKIASMTKEIQKQREAIEEIEDE